MKKALGMTGTGDIRRHQSTLFAEIAIAFPVTIALWLGVYYFLPPLSGMEDTLARLMFALKCCCIAILFCFLSGIEAVAHERFRSPAIDPLSGYENASNDDQPSLSPAHARTTCPVCPRTIRAGLLLFRRTLDARGCRDHRGVDRYAFRFLDWIPLWVAASRHWRSRHDAKHAGPPLCLCEDRL